MADEPRIDSDRSSRIEGILFAALIALHLVPIWAFRYLVTQDGPAHLENALILRDWFTGSAALHRPYYLLNPYPEPNLLGHAILAVLTTFLPPLVAEKTLVSLFVIGLPLAARYTLCSIRPGAASLAILAFPFIYGLAFHKGIYNFCLSLPLWLVLTGYWFRHARDLRLGQAGILCVLSLLLFFAHVVSFGMALVTIGVVGLFQIILSAAGKEGCMTHGAALLSPRPVRRERQGEGLGIRSNALTPTLSRRTGRGGKARNQASPKCHAPGKELLKPLLRSAALTILALLPSGLLLAWFFIRHGGAPGQAPQVWPAAIQLLRLDSLVSFTGNEQHAALAVAVVFFILLAIAVIHLLLERKIVPADGLLVAAGAAVVVYFFTPNSAASGGLITFRLSLYPYLLLMLWFAARRLPRAVYTTTFAILSLISIICLIDRANSYREIQPMLDEYVSAAQYLEPGSTLLTIYPSDRDATAEGKLLNRMIRPFIHANGLIAAQTQIIDLTNYEASAGHFPILFRGEVNPEKLINGAYRDVLDYPIRSGGLGRVDYVMIWRTRREMSLRLALLQAQLDEGYELVYRSPHGFATLYRHKATMDNFSHRWGTDKHR